MTTGTAPGTPAVREADWRRACELIRGAEEVALACHVCPDGDALGSMLGLGLALRGAGTRVSASFGDRRFEVPRLLRYLPGQELLTEPGDCPAEPDLMITFDTPSVDRLGLLAPNAGKAQELIVIDHHPSNTGFGTVPLVDPAAASTSMLVEELLGRLGCALDRDIATCLYTGLVTDTGSFRHSSTTPAAHRMAARLVEAGLRTDEIARELWDRSPFSYLKVLAAALERATLDREAAGGHGMVWTYVRRDDRAAHCLPYAECEGIIDVIRRTDEPDVAVVLKEDDEGAWQVSTRSKGMVDVGRACTLLGGGGHVRAAGFTSHDSPERTIARLRAVLGPTT
ncbi:bifunctional oligoribonuclease and PAP phosphatase NrnA [Sphaerisporangium krabiense]|uniref:Phosphoesterase RecJ-like protein n=1 Tax=Sphaerisporangium krabiense TaxID=763782 RepID=A0A7W8Z7Q8_9ACTN|nr:bifunctional oligoribonuclease/PAP phosphatase NrnA [Sphaerisporangium krabiense]MBB5628633.1 phosphoesterase RecJ-like protein [Sphaerisporangium krabiense]GII60529.1 bifunctional oligoribonuclease and PAP phosphatase NrnA [Sphaerisporangium krabiense]